MLDRRGSISPDADWAPDLDRLIAQIAAGLISAPADQVDAKIEAALGEVSRSCDLQLATVALEDKWIVAISTTISSIAIRPCPRRSGTARRDCGERLG